MVTERLDTAVRNFQQTNQMVERYTRLSRAYVQLAERFNQLDVEHMTLKSQVIPLLQALKSQKTRIEKLQQALEQKTIDHRQELQTVTQAYEERLNSLSHDIQELKPLESLFTAQVYEDLITAEEQIDLVEATLQEMAEDSSPDLNDEEKALLAAYQADPDLFLAASVNDNFDHESSQWTVVNTPAEDRVTVSGY
ncbi:MAG: hypothetical protein LVS60_17945 [Nodosilinea sp. LVE1205-7]|jgi:chromosome segregation ATPase